MVVFGAVIDQQQDTRSGKAVNQQIEQCLGFVIYPVEVLEDNDQRLTKTLADQNALNGFQGAPTLELRIELRQWIVAVLLNVQQDKQVWQGVLQAAIQG